MSSVSKNRGGTHWGGVLVWDVKTNWHRRNLELDSHKIHTPIQLAIRDAKFSSRSKVRVWDSSNGQLLVDIPVIQ